MSRNITGCVTVFLSIAFLVLAVPDAVQGDPCLIDGDLAGYGESSHPELGAFEYNLLMSWDTGSDLGLLDFSLYLDEFTKGCTCGQMSAGVTPGDTVGFSETAKGRSKIYYYAEVLCDGDPIVPVEGKLLRFTPFPGQSSDPDSTGSGTFTFFSNYPPFGIGYSNLYLKNANGDFACYGGIAGVFPGLPCDPVAEKRASWGALKSVYRH